MKNKPKSSYSYIGISTQASDFLASSVNSPAGIMRQGVIPRAAVVAELHRRMDLLRGVLLRIGGVLIRSLRHRRRLHVPLLRAVI